MTNIEFLEKCKLKCPTLIPLEEYKNSASPMLTECAICKHRWYIRTNHLSFGDANCPKCSNRKRAKSHEEFKKQLAIVNPNLTLLSTYTNSSSKVKIRCNICGTENFVIAANLLKQGGCKKCGGLIKRTNEEIIKDFQKVHGMVYDYSKVNFTDLRVPVEIICKKHGPFMQRPDSHLSGNGCKLCFFEKRSDTTESFIQKAINIHGDLFDYSKVSYIDSHTPVEIICKEHGPFMQAPNNHLNSKTGCPICKSSLGERLIRKFFISKNILIEQQKTFKDLYDQSIRNKLKYDFYIESYNLLIEFNGIQHYKFVTLWYKNYHEYHKALHRDWLKRKYAKDHNFNYLVIPYTELNNINNILELKLLELGK